MRNLEPPGPNEKGSFRSGGANDIGSTPKLKNAGCPTQPRQGRLSQNCWDWKKHLLKLRRSIISRIILILIIHLLFIINYYVLCSFGFFSFFFYKIFFFFFFFVFFFFFCVFICDMCKKDSLAKGCVCIYRDIYGTQAPIGYIIWSK